jgi:hypothetical protein
MNTIPQCGALSNSHIYSLQLTITRTESSWSAVPHYSSGTGFQLRTFSFLGPRTVPATLPQQHLTQMHSLELPPLVQICTVWSSLNNCFNWTSVQYLLHWRSNNNSLLKLWSFIYYYLLYWSSHNS